MVYMLKSLAIGALALANLATATGQNSGHTAATDQVQQPEFTHAIDMLDHAKAVVDHFLGIDPFFENDTHVAYRQHPTPGYLSKETVMHNREKAVLAVGMMSDLTVDHKDSVENATQKLFDIIGVTEDTISSNDTATIKVQLTRFHEAFLKASGEQHA